MSDTYWEDRQKKGIIEPPLDQPSIFCVFAQTYFKDKGRVLELGAGRGQDAEYLARRGYSVLATDIFNEVLNELRERVRNNHVHIDIYHLDIRKDFPYDDETFDVVFANLSLHYFDSETTKKVFQEIHRVINKGGIFAALFNSYKDPDQKKYESEEIEPHFFNTPGGITRRYFSPPFLAECIEEFFDPLLLDGKGTTHTFTEPILIRLIAKKI